MVYSLYLDLNSETIMAKHPWRKRPCCICRKWFQADPRQKGRQKTCSPECSREQHRRKCKQWNNKHREQSKDDYLGKKLEAVEQSLTSGPSFEVARHPPIFPQEIIINEYGKKNLIILRYLVFLVLKQARIPRSGIP